MRKINGPMTELAVGAEGGVCAATEAAPATPPEQPNTEQIDYFLFPLTPGLFLVSELVYSLLEETVADCKNGVLGPSLHALGPEGETLFAIFLKKAARQMSYLGAPADHEQTELRRRICGAKHAFLTVAQLWDESYETIIKSYLFARIWNGAGESGESTKTTAEKRQGAPREVSPARALREMLEASFDIVMSTCELARWYPHHQHAKRPADAAARFWWRWCLDEKGLLRLKQAVRSLMASGLPKSAPMATTVWLVGDILQSMIAEQLNQMRQIAREFAD